MEYGGHRLPSNFIYTAHNPAPRVARVNPSGQSQSLLRVDLLMILFECLYKNVRLLPCLDAPWYYFTTVYLFILSYEGAIPARAEDDMTFWFLRHVGEQSAANFASNAAFIRTGHEHAFDAPGGGKSRVE